MYFLGLDFVITSVIWLVIVGGLVFIFREHFAKLFYKNSSFDVFISKLKILLEKNYPDIKFDYSIIEQSKVEQNPDARKYLIIDNIVDQYTKIKIDSTKLPNSTPQNLQWGSYIFNSEPNKNKLPTDWVQRKNALLIRDNKKCFRCSKHIDINTIDIYMIRSLLKGGKYFLENLLPVCKDCDRILSKDLKKMNHLDIKDLLYDIIQNS